MHSSAFMSNHLIQPALCEGELIQLRISPGNQIAKANHRKSVADAVCANGLPFRELAEQIGGVDDSVVAQAVRRLEERIQKDSRLLNAFEILQRRFSELSHVKT